MCHAQVVLYIEHVGVHLCLLLPQVQFRRRTPGHQHLPLPLYNPLLAGNPVPVPSIFYFLKFLFSLLQILYLQLTAFFIKFFLVSYFRLFEVLVVLVSQTHGHILVMDLVQLNLGLTSDVH